MKKHLILSLIILSTVALSQSGGTTAFRFLDVPATARAAALGGNNMSIWGDDINLIHANPALLNPLMLKQAAFNYCNYVSNINSYYATYAHSIKDKGTGAIGVQAFNYGNFNGYDELGQKTNNFKAADYSINLNFAKPIADSLFNIGVALKTIISQYDVYKSFGNAIDFGVTFHNKRDFTVSLLAKNIGLVWKTYTGNEALELPNTVQLGFSYKPSKAPFRLFLVYDQLLKWNLRYISPVDTTGRSSALNFNETVKDSTSWEKFSTRAGSQADNFMRHIVFGTEILLSKNFHLRIAYNYRRQKEMTLPDRRGSNGLSFGFGLKTKRFQFSYAFSKVAFSGNSSTIGVTYRW